MSIEVVKRVWESSGVKGSSLVVLLALADSADEWGVAHFRDDLLAQRCRVSVVGLGRILKRLEQAGEILRRGNRAAILVGADRQYAERGLQRWEVSDER